MSGDLPAFMVANYRRHGPAFRLEMLGREFTVLAGRDANVFMTHAGAAQLRSREAWERFNLEFGAPRALTNLDGEPHARLRKVMKQGYSRDAVAGRLEVLVRVARDETTRWPLGQPMPVNAALKPLVVEQLGVLIGGRSPRPYVTDLVRFLRLNLMVNVTGVLPRLLLRWPPYRRSRARCLELARSVLQACRSGEAPRQEVSLLHDILDAVKADPSLLGPDEMANAVLGPFVAGLDTVANSITFILYRLLAHSDVMERARAEAEAMFAQGAPNPERLPYLKAVCMEALRLHPVAPLGIRFAQQELEFAGCRIHKDAALMMATAVPHFLEEYYPAPERFEPERFQPPRHEHRRQGVYAPYGLGTHTCLGAGLAELQMVLTTATLLHQVRFKLHPTGYRLRAVMSPTLMPSRDFQMVVTERRAHV